MLTRDGIIARYIFAFCFFFLPGTKMIQGWPATISGLLGSVELAVALMSYSPVMELLDRLLESRKTTDRIGRS